MSSSATDSWSSKDGKVRFVPVHEEGTGGIWCQPGHRPEDFELACKLAESAGYAASTFDEWPTGWHDEAACWFEDADGETCLVLIPMY